LYLLYSNKIMEKFIKGVIFSRKMGLREMLRSIVPTTKREKGYVIAGITALMLAAGAYGGYRVVEGKYPHILKRFLGNKESVVDCGERIKKNRKVQFEDLPLEEVVEQTIFTTYSKDSGTGSGFRYLTPADTLSYEKGEIVALKEQAQRRICENKKTQGSIPVFVGDEGEGGYVTRLDLGLPPAEVLGLYYEGKLTNDVQKQASLLKQGEVLPTKEEREQKLKQIFANAARILKDAKVDYVFGPVVDVVRDRESKDNLMSAHDRAFSSDAQTVIALARMYIEAMHGQQIKVIGKHYFGTGYTTVDPHKGLPVLGQLSSEQRQQIELPFRELAKDLDGIMVTHILGHNMQIPDSVNVDAYRYIREGLGYKGLIITDDLDMGAIEERYADKNNWVVEASLDALVAGADGVILKLPEDVAAVKEAIMARMGKDVIFRGVMKDKFLRLMKFKEQYIDEPVKVENVLAGEEEKGKRWLQRRMGKNEYVLGVVAGEDGEIAGYNSKGKLYVKDQEKFDFILREFAEKNGGVTERKIVPGKVYLLPDLNNDGMISYGTFEKQEGEKLEKFRIMQRAFFSGQTFRWYLAGELGYQAIVDEEGELLPVTRGKLKKYTQQFLEDNENIPSVNKIIAGRTYKFRDYNKDGKITFRNPVN
jgi:beta-glucosidase-like glycosyl hydrolase